MKSSRAKHRSAQPRTAALRHVIRDRLFVSSVAVLVALGTASSASAAIIYTDDQTAEEQLASQIVAEAGEADRQWDQVEPMESILPVREEAAAESEKAEAAETPEEEVEEEEEPAVEETTGSTSSESSGTSVDISAECSDYSGNKAIGCTMTLDRGWGMGEFSCLLSLWERESNWNEAAYNSSSGAFGIPQSLPGDKMASAGSDWQTNPATQIKWGLGYISDRYGSPCGAWSHSESVGWY
ncbi:hypothetical protein [Glycomyces sp. NRRL B-16210]|uniref:aggregation-promoting factor C-terminal-like domain-containing protein n=1 Tax=Glycomyces sp. NRRL B-16210 TaxID=1463821 RepID=UPI0018CC69AA|nr:hypothetical protein [Glycomyces sp. NRRL B-16210]